MTLDDVHYFSHNRLAHPQEYAMAKRVESMSSSGDSDRVEFERRLANLASHTGYEEHQLQAGNFVCELQVFDMLSKQNKRPHWCPESKAKGIKAPDFYYVAGPKKMPVEVKMLGLDAIEGNALRGHIPEGYSSGSDGDYFEGCKKKLDSFFTDVQLKLDHFNQAAGLPGEFYLFFFPSQHVRFRDGEDGKPLMHERIKDYAQKNLAPHIKIEIINALDAYSN